MALPPNRMSRYLRFSTVGLELGFSVLIGLFVGQWLDKLTCTNEWFVQHFVCTEPWLLLLFLMFGMVAGFRSVYRLLRDLNEDIRREDEDAKRRS